MKKLIMIAFSLLAACAKKDDPASSSTGPLSIRVMNSANGLLQGTSYPIWLGQFNGEVYFYRPNQSLQLGSGQNWSRWTLVPNLAGPWTDIVAMPNQQLSLDSMAGSYYYKDLTSQWVSQVGLFSIDAFHLTGSLGIINQQNSACGAYVGSLHDEGNYPWINFSTNCVNRQFVSSVDGKNLQLLQILFVRKDWFSQPVQVYAEYSTVNTASFSCFHSNIALSAFQIEILDGLFADMFSDSPGTWTLGHYTQSCQANPNKSGTPYTVVPQTSDVPIVQLTAKSVPQPDLVTPQGNVIPQPPATVFGQSLESLVSFNLTSSMIGNEASLNDSTQTSTITLSPAANGMPWGLSIDFKSVIPAVQ